MNPLPLPRYVLSGPHLSGYRVVLGYETLADAQDAQAALALPMGGVGLDREGQVSDEIGQLTDVFERPFDGEDDPRLRVARVLTRAEAEAVLEHSGDLIAILSALPEAGPAEVGWRPIESAPRDGTHIRALQEGTTFGWWDGRQAPEIQTVVHWWGNPGEEGFYTSVNELEPQQPFQATHWRPLDGLPPSPAG